MMKLTPDMVIALAAHRAEYVRSNPGRCKTDRGAERAWREHLTNAWLRDWPEQWGMLRSVRNEVGIEEAFLQFAAVRATPN